MAIEAESEININIEKVNTYETIVVQQMISKYIYLFYISI